MVQSVERAVQILKCFEKQEALGLGQIANKTSLHKSTAYNLVSTLLNLSLLEKNQHGKYKLGLELFRLGQNVDVDEFRYVSFVLKELADMLGETVNYVKKDKDCVVYVNKVESKHSMRICTTIGQCLPMYCTAGGKAILAFLPEEESEKIVDAYQYFRYTDNTIDSPENLKKTLQEIREKKFAIDKEELEKGLVCVAVPLCNEGGYPVGAISCSGPVTRMTEEKIDQCSTALIKCIRDLCSSANPIFALFSDAPPNGRPIFDPREIG